MGDARRVPQKKLRKQRKKQEDGGALQQQNREVAEGAARKAAQTGDKYDELVAEGSRHSSEPYNPRVTQTHTHFPFPLTTDSDRSQA